MQTDHGVVTRRCSCEIVGGGGLGLPENGEWRQWAVTDLVVVFVLRESKVNGKSSCYRLTAVPKFYPVHLLLPPLFLSLDHTFYSSQSIV
ncbi:hypothetical protein L1987_34626 [Smallanthus sonchifolius]|uniref:Uncharacterized protein n=1 Tax=Smallanthus sonchifolius TaxID=185202 RepID=A0ACB9HV70_9ASTR|nr:hypothetical protein L1987_34626 [Smallanthus sonchifolius]